MSEESPPPARTILTAESKPYLPRHVKLRHDASRGRWVLLAPERVYDPAETAVAILRLADGGRTVDAIARHLASEYDAPHETILVDALAMLQDLADKGVIKT